MPRKTKMNSITSPELLKQINSENRELLDEFVNYLKSTGKSEGTISSYIGDINIAWVWCLQYNNNKSFINWSKRNVVNYQNWLINENGNSPARVKRFRSNGKFRC